MEFLQLYYFYESAKNESFALTAKKYMVPTSSVSASVKRLEKEIGTNLFDRTSNRIKLNEKGLTFFQTLEEVFQKINNTVSSISDTNTQNTTISILIKARRKWISKLIIEYKKLFPNVIFSISHNALSSNFKDFDIIIDQETDEYVGRESFLLSVEQICVKAAKDHPLVKKTLSFSDLKDQPFLVSQIGSRMWNLLNRTARRSGFVPKILIESNDSGCILNYAEAGLGLVLGSRRALLDQNLAALTITDFNETQSVYVYHRSTPKCDISLSGFISFLKIKGSEATF